MAKLNVSAEQFEKVRTLAEGCKGKEDEEILQAIYDFILNYETLGSTTYNDPPVFEIAYVLVSLKLFEMMMTAEEKQNAKEQLST
jgi:hypothetical protein